MPDSFNTKHHAAKSISTASKRAYLPPRLREAPHATAAIRPRPNYVLPPPVVHSRGQS